jgi:hypothetical protein
MGNYSNIFPAGTGFWVEQDQSAEFVSAPGAIAALPLPIDGRLVGGDATGIYVQGQQTAQDANYPLLREPNDGSPPFQIATAPVSGSGITETDYEYLAGGLTSFATPDGYLHLWEFKATPDSPLALWLQWAPLP